MRVIDHHERIVIFEDDAEMPAEIFIHYGGHRVRKRMQPTSLTVRWETNGITGEWELCTVYILGHHVHKTASNSFLHYIFRWSGPQWSGDRKVDLADVGEIPDWVSHHVALSHPLFQTTVYTAVKEAIDLLLRLTSPAS